MTNNTLQPLKVLPKEQKVINGLIMKIQRRVGSVGGLISFFVGMESFSQSSMKWLGSKILAWHVADLPCADFFCPEGRSQPCQDLVCEKPSRNPFLPKFLQLCNDVESNPGPDPGGGGQRRRSNSKNRNRSKDPSSRSRRQQSRPQLSEDESDSSGRGRIRGRGREGSIQRVSATQLESKHDALEGRVNTLEDQVCTTIFKTLFDRENRRSIERVCCCCSGICKSDN